MPFSPEERQVFTSELQRQGWQLREGTLWSPTGGIWLEDSHFTHWGPAEMGEVFDCRGRRIEAQHPSRQALIAEHRQVCAAIARICRLSGSSVETEPERL